MPTPACSPLPPAAPDAAPVSAGLPGPVQVGDVSDFGRGLLAWNATYEQLAPGCFEGGAEELWIDDGLEVLWETGNRSVWTAGSNRAGMVSLGIPMQIAMRWRRRPETTPARARSKGTWRRLWGTKRRQRNSPIGCRAAGSTRNGSKCPASADSVRRWTGPMGTLRVQRDCHGVESVMLTCWRLFPAFYHNDKIIAGSRLGRLPAIPPPRAHAMVKVWRRR